MGHTPKRRVQTGNSETLPTRRPSRSDESLTTAEQFYALAGLTRATGRQLSASEAERYRTVQRQAYRKTFLTSGMRHSKFVGALTALSPEGARKVAEVASVLVPEDSQ